MKTKYCRDCTTAYEGDICPECGGDEVFDADTQEEANQMQEDEIAGMQF